MKALALIALLLLSGCLADHRNKQDANQSIPGIWPREEKDPAPISKGSGEVVASNNASEISQNGIVPVVVSKIAETFKPEFSAIREASAKVLSDLKFEIQQKNEVNAKALSDIRVEFQQRNDVLVSAFEGVRIELEQKNEVRARADAQAIAALKAEISSFSQEMRAGRDIHNQTIQFSNEFRQALKDAHESHIETVKFFCFLAAQVSTALFMYLRFSRKQESAEQLALIKQRGNHETGK